MLDTQVHLPRPVVIGKDVELSPLTGGAAVLTAMNRLRLGGSMGEEVSYKAYVQEDVNQLLVVLARGVPGQEPRATETLQLLWLYDWVWLGQP